MKHPLVTIVDKPESFCSNKCNYHIIVIRKSESKENLLFGRSYKDFRSTTVSFYLPFQKIDLSECRFLIAFDNDYLDNVCDEFSLFEFNDKESLHLSESDDMLLTSTVELIKTELQHDIDTSTRSVLRDHIHLLLNYCKRFYKYQLILREKENKETIGKLENIVSNYLKTDMMLIKQLPTDDYIATLLGHTNAYLNALTKEITGKTIAEYTGLLFLNECKNRVIRTTLPITEIAYQMGFSSAYSFRTVFRRLTGNAPSYYRRYNKCR